MRENCGKFTLAGAQDYLATEPDMETSRLSDRLWTITDGNCRTLFIEADTSIIAYDTFGTPGRARVYKRAMEAAIPDKPIKTLIYTHDHLDHSGYAADLAADAEIIADVNCAKVITLRKAEGQLQPTRIITGDANKMNIDGVEFTLLNPGPTHGSGNVSSYFAEEKLLFSSDTILANAKYGFMPDYHICNFVKFMRSFLELDWETFVPGRFELTDRAGFEKGCDLIEAVQTESQQAFAEFVPIWSYDPMQAYVSNKLGGKYGDMDGFNEHIGQMAMRIVHHYLMGGWGLEDTPEPDLVLAGEVTL